MTDRRQRSDTRAAIRHLISAMRGLTEELGHLRREILQQRVRLDAMQQVTCDLGCAIARADARAEIRTGYPEVPEPSDFRWSDETMQQWEDQIARHACIWPSH